MEKPNLTPKINVIPAKAGIHRRAAARHKNPKVYIIPIVADSYARYRKRWIPAFAGMTLVFIGKTALNYLTCRLI
jgi:hypothetical protein